MSEQIQIECEQHRESRADAHNRSEPYRRGRPTAMVFVLENGGKLHLEFLFTDFSWPQVVHWPNEPPGLDALWGCSDGIRRKPSGRGTKKQFDLASAKVSPGGVHCAPCRI